MSFIGPKIYYLLFQITASLLIAVIGIVIGLLVAWLIWGRRKWRIIEAEKRIAELNALLGEK